jgi:hypothetical protein
MAKPASPQSVDGQLEAVRLLRALERLNWTRNQPRKSTAALIAAMLASNTWPTKERERFARAISDWLVDAVLGFVPELDAYERASHAKAVRTDTGFQTFIARATCSAAPGEP